MSYPTSPPSPGRHHLDASFGAQAADPRDSHPGSGGGWLPRPGFEHRDWPPAQRQEPTWWDGVNPTPGDERGGETAPTRPLDPPRAAPPPQPAVWTDELPTHDEIVWADVRNQVASCLKSINSKHCHEAFDRISKRNALSPHGIVLFYAADDRTQPHGYRLMFVTRLFLAGPESDDLAQVINDVTRSAAANIARAVGSGRSWDPRGPEDSMVNGGDMSMPRDAGFIGTGVTTLDTEQGAFTTIANSIFHQPMDSFRPKSVFDIPGQGLALLTDGTALRAVRDPNRRLGDDGITCNKTLDPTRARYWNPHSDITTRGEPAVRAAWSQLAALHETLKDYLLAGRTS